MTNQAIPSPCCTNDYTAETYIITSGSGILTTGGVIENKKPGTGVPNVMNGPSGIAGRGAYTRKVQAGDIVITPAGLPTAGAKSQIT